MLKNAHQFKQRFARNFPLNVALEDILLNQTTCSPSKVEGIDDFRALRPRFVVLDAPSQLRPTRGPRQTRSPRKTFGCRDKGEVRAELSLNLNWP